MSAYSSIQPLALRLKTSGHLRQEYCVLRLPDAWRRAFEGLARKGADGEARTVPVRSVSAAVRMLLPDITSVEGWKGVSEGRPWLVGLTPVDRRAVLAIVRAWAQSDFGAATDEARQMTASALAAGELEWESASIDVARWRVSRNGTAEAEDGDTWSLLPLIVTQCLSKCGFIAHDGTKREWARCDSNRGAQVVSWPPFAHEARQRPTHYYSIIATVTVQTRPFDPQPVIHLHLGIRRWVSAVSDRGLYLRQPVTVHMRPAAAWLPEAQISRAFQAGKLEWSRGEVRWGDQVSQLLRHLTLTTPIPSPTELLAEPARYLLADDAFGVTYQHGMIPSHRVAPGLNPVDRARLFDQACAALSGMAVTGEALARVKIPSLLPRQRTRPARSGGERTRARIASAAGPRLLLEIYRQDAGVDDLVGPALCALLGTPETKAGEIWSWTDPPFELEVATRPFPAWLGQLDVPDRRRGALEAAIVARRREVVGELGRSKSLALALVELPGPDVFKNGDPKLADRVGLAAAGRVSQFLVPGDDAVGERIPSALADLLLRQAGVMPVGYEGDLGAAAPVVGIWVVRSNADRFRGRSAVCLPIAVRLIPGVGRVEAATMAGPGTATGWIAYPDILLRAAEFAVGRAKMTGDEVEAFVAGVVRSMPEGSVVLTAAQNLRQFLPALRDPALDDRLPGAGPAIAHVRLRTADQYEAPQYFAGTTANASVATGAWRLGDSVFASTGDKPASQRNWRATSSKLARPSSGSWNPRILEMTVARSGGREPQWLAAFVHQLRWLAPHHPEALGLPVPLHLARLVEEYALGTPPVVEQQESGSDELAE